MSSRDQLLRHSYAVAAGAAATAAASSDAAIVYSGLQNLSIGQFSSLNLNLDGDAYGDLTLKNYVFGGGNYMGATVNFAPGKLVGFNAGLSYVSALSAGFVIDAFSAGPSFFGLSFAVGSNLYYGWVRVSVNQATGSFVIHDWAYENSGAGIAAGAVPAPGALGLLALGPAGLGVLRGRKRSS
jgi:hypothetical protein